MNYFDFYLELNSGNDLFEIEYQGGKIYWNSTVTEGYARR
jgi:hypothetical protein